MSDRVDRLHARARRIASGTEARVSLAVDMLFPLPALLSGLQGFTQRFEHVDLHLRTEALGAVAQLVLDGISQLGISTELDLFPHELSTRPLCQVLLVPVCGPDHRLAALPSPVSPDVLRDEVQIVVIDRSRRTEGEDRAVFSERTWRVADLHSKRALLAASFGWGLMPLHHVESDLESGALTRLAVDGWDEEPVLVPLLAVYRTADPPGPAASWLLERLTEAAAGVPGVQS